MEGEGGGEVEKVAGKEREERGGGGGCWMVGLAKFAVTDPKASLTRSLPLFCSTSSKDKVRRNVWQLADCLRPLLRGCGNGDIKDLGGFSQPQEGFSFAQFTSCKKAGKKTILTSITVRSKPCCQANGQGQSSQLEICCHCSRVIA